MIPTVKTVWKLVII